MYTNHVVPIPDVPGKIVRRKLNGEIYIRYEIGRTYDPNRRSTNVKRVQIGIQIPGKPNLMLPNENYLTYFAKGAYAMSTEERDEINTYESEREHNFMLRDFFDQLFYEFQMMARKNPEGIVNENKVKRINRILAPLMEMMRDQEYTQFLELIPEPRTQETADGKTNETGMNYGDVALLLTQFKVAVNRFFQKRM